MPPKRLIRLWTGTTKPMTGSTGGRRTSITRLGNSTSLPTLREVGADEGERTFHFPLSLPVGRSFPAMKVEVLPGVVLPWVEGGIRFTVPAMTLNSPITDA